MSFTYSTHVLGIIRVRLHVYTMFVCLLLVYFVSRPDPRFINKVLLQKYSQRCNASRLGEARVIMATNSS